MGCGGSKDKEEGVHAHLSHWMTNLGMEKLDETFAEAAKVIEQVEELRVTIVDAKDDLMINSGACSYLDPQIDHAFFGIAYKLSADNKGKFLDCGIDLDLEAMTMTLKGTNNSADALKAFDNFKEYFTGIKALPDKVKELSEKMTDLSKKLVEDPAAMIEEVSETFKDNMFQIPGKVMALKNNINLVRLAVTCSVKLAAELTKNMAFLKDVATLLKDLEKITKIDTIGANANKHKYVKAYEITWNLMEDPKQRFGKKAEEGVKRWDDRKNNKAAAKEKTKQKASS
jgi:hypothetical protein